MQQKQANDAKQAQTTSDSFLTENAKKPGVKTTASGLQYKITQEGTGKQPTASSVVTVHYKGQLVDGKVFDSSLERGEPIEFPLNQVIRVGLKVYNS
jgi:FKBP-type peptidyl-prolyl cis-trans isomerase FkpA/FKBP-type peptidyl-prolyl cis-trans isomerase FklB